MKTEELVILFIFIIGLNQSFVTSWSLPWSTGGTCCFKNSLVRKDIDSLTGYAFCVLTQQVTRDLKEKGFCNDGSVATGKFCGLERCNLAGCQCEGRCASSGDASFSSKSINCQDVVKNRQFLTNHLVDNLPQSGSPFLQTLNLNFKIV